MGDLLGGRPDDPGCYRDGRVEYELVRQKPFFRRGIERLRHAWSQEQRVALLCSELRPEQCHRSKLIGATLAAEGIDVAHLDENDAPLTQQEVMLRLNRGQPSLFGDDFMPLTSRKRYEAGTDEEDGLEP
jgi:hypothetical protein